ncbi:MAG: translation initiation factor IF-3 [Patescibacteria group bacterium]|nr:translation initiation factor IF-3 [Patescibacteria group bacterium]
MRRLFYRTNWQIKADKVRLIGEDGKQIGTLSLIEARELARQKGLDLVEIAQKANPPVVKIVNYAKFKYQLAKKEKETRKGSKKGERLKEIRLTPFIGRADLETRINRAKKFSKKGDRLKVVVKFLGRQITQKDFGFRLLDQVRESLKEFYLSEREPKFSGRQLIMFLTPVKIKNKKNGPKDQKTENPQVGSQPV